MEATFQEVRQHLGFEAGRHWSEVAIRRTAPALLGLFSLVDTPRPPTHGEGRGRRPTNGLVRQEASDLLSDALALVRKQLWAQEAAFCGSLREPEKVKAPREFVKG